MKAVYACQASPAGRRIRPGQTISEPVCSLDLFPTFCQRAGTKPPAECTLDGSDISALLQGEPFSRPAPLYWHYYHSLGRPKAAMRVGDWVILGSWKNAEELKPISGMPPGDMEILKTAQLTDFELFNVRDDLGEQHDVASTEPERLRRCPRC